jgi:hypothetical protein
MIICGFPAIGKTTFSNQHLDVLDLDSSQFNWINKDNAERERNPKFPQNYIDAVEEHIGKFKYILISTHYLVRDELNKRSLPYVTIIPSLDCYWEYQDRMKKRGDSEKMIYLVSYCWYDWITERYKEKYPIILQVGETLTSAITLLENQGLYQQAFVEK